MSIQPFFDLTQDDLASYLKGLGKEKFRSKQLFRWVYTRRVHDFEAMTDISKKFRSELPGLLDLELPELVRVYNSVDGTRKYLFATHDNLSFESVLIPSEGRLTLCISSEVGCNMACKFCYTGKQKLKRRLTTREIVGQLLRVWDDLPESTRITNVVFMGMGEPLDNIENVTAAIKIWHDPSGLNLSRKKITVSTSGIVPLIPSVTEAGVRLAVSLNATTDVLRDEIMPINKKYPIKELMAACQRHYAQSKDRVTFEYVLLKGVTDSLFDARRLYELTRSVPSKINLIAFNEHPQSGFKRPDDQVVDRFQRELVDLGAHVLRRRTMGRDIYAACGQLTSFYKGRPERLGAQA